MLENLKKRILSVINPVNEGVLSSNGWEKRNDNKFGEFYSNKAWQSNLDGVIGHRFILKKDSSLFSNKWNLLDYSNSKNYSISSVKELSKLVSKNLRK